MLEGCIDACRAYIGPSKAGRGLVSWGRRKNRARMEWMDAARQRWGVRGCMGEGGVRCDAMRCDAMRGG